MRGRTSKVRPRPSIYEHICQTTVVGNLNAIKTVGRKKIEILYKMFFIRGGDEKQSRWTYLTITHYHLYRVRVGRRVLESGEIVASSILVLKYFTQ